MVNFEILLHKLKLSGLKAQSVRWFRSYISGRSQVTRVGTSKSSAALVTCGVPQGSILGPLLFTAYINDLPDCLINSKANLYADDTAVTFSPRNPKEMENTLSQSLTELGRWFSKSKLSLNLKKSKLMFFRTRQQIQKLGNIKISHNNTIIEQVESFKLN